ncbi:helix-turn-helix transcriptional regulator [Brevundimonas sp. GCM10030266]|uniref:helix-turn-helix transcriptional regulator n=1 Tax=Brevundimonas sp. GCM10030266 TaxID=3273386 RepID=UPI003623A902
MSDEAKRDTACGGVRQTGALEQALKSASQTPLGKVSQLTTPLSLSGIGNLANLGSRVSALTSLGGLTHLDRIGRTVSTLTLPSTLLDPALLTSTARAPEGAEGAPQAALPPPPKPATTALPIQSVSDLGRIVRERRLAMSLTQQDLADAAGTGRRFISELETGKASLEIDKVLKVCRYVGVDLFARVR